MMPFGKRTAPLRKAKRIARFIGLDPGSLNYAMETSNRPVRTVVTTAFRVGKDCQRERWDNASGRVVHDWNAAIAKAMDSLSITDDLRNRAVTEALRKSPNTANFTDRVLWRSASSFGYRVPCTSCSEGKVVCGNCRGARMVDETEETSKPCGNCNRYGKIQMCTNRNGVRYRVGPFAEPDWQGTVRWEPCPKCDGDGDITTKTKVRKACPFCQATGKTRCFECGGGQFLFGLVRGTISMSAETTVATDPRQYSEHYGIPASVSHDPGQPVHWQGDSAIVKTSADVPCEWASVKFGSRRIDFMLGDRHPVAMASFDDFVVSRFSTAPEYSYRGGRLRLRMGRLPATRLERLILLGWGSTSERRAAALGKAGGTLSSTAIDTVATVVEPIRRRIRNRLVAAAVIVAAGTGLFAAAETGLLNLAS